MRTIVLSLLFAFAFSSVAAQAKARPPDFDLPDGSGHAIFVHFVSAEYNVTFDIRHKKTRVRSVISFVNEKPGMPIFDLVDEPTSVTVDGTSSRQRLIEAPGSSEAEKVQFRVVGLNVAPGPHTLVIEHELKAFAATFRNGSVSSGFFMSDFDPRGLLERYLPANLEFDQVAMKLNIEVLGATGDETREEAIFTNGRVTRVAKDRWSIRFPDYFNCSAPFFHIRPKDETKVLKYRYASIDRREIPVTIYKAAGVRDDLNAFRKVLDRHLALYERLFGPFPHETMTVFDSGVIGGGMEYSGATFTDLDSLAHELAHSFFGRGVMPADGNAGWIDEAMATYVSSGDSPPNPDDIKPGNMGAHSRYFRANDSAGYYFGVNFLAYLDRLFAGRSSSLGMNGFLAVWKAERTGTVTTTAVLKSDLERYSGINLSGLFEKYVYGRVAATVPPSQAERRRPHLHLPAAVVRRVQ